MVEDKAIAERIFDNIVDEFNRTKNILLKLTNDEELLDHTPNIKDSVLSQKSIR